MGGIVTMPRQGDGHGASPALRGAMALQPGSRLVAGWVRSAVRPGIVLVSAPLSWHCACWCGTAAQYCAVPYLPSGWVQAACRCCVESQDCSWERNTGTCGVQCTGRLTCKIARSWLPAAAVRPMAVSHCHPHLAPCFVITCPGESTSACPERRGLLPTVPYWT